MRRIPQLLAMVACMVSAVFTLHAQHHEWAKAVLGGQCQVMDVIHTADGGVVMVGSFYTGPIDLNPGAAVHNVPLVVTDPNGFIVRLDSNGNYLWGGSVEGPSGAFGVVTDAAGNVYMAGHYFGVADFDPGPSVDYHGQPGSGAFLSKFDPAGQYLWTKAFHKMGLPGYPTSISIDPSDRIYLFGQFQDSTDFDAGPGTLSLATMGNSDGFFAQYDTQGNLNWVRQLQGGAGEVVINLAADASGIYLQGFYLDSVDMDPDPGLQHWLLEPSEGTWADDQFIGHYSPSGAFLWARQLYSDSRLFIRAMELDAQHHLVMGGYYGDSVDFDPGPGTNWLYVNPSVFNTYVLKWDSSGAFLWVRDLGTEISAVTDLATTSTGGIQVLTTFKDTADMDPGVGVFPLIAPGLIFTEAALMELDGNGIFIDAKQIGGPGPDQGYAISMDAQDRIFIGGTFRQTADFDPSAGVDAITSGQYGSGFVLKWSQDSCAGLQLRIDTVAPVNCTSQSGWMQASAHGGTAPYNFAWTTTPPTTGPSANPVEGIYTVMLTDSLGCAAARTVVVDGPADFNAFDLEVNLIPHSIFRPGSPTTLTLDAFNDGCPPVTGLLKLSLDPQLVYQAATPTPDSVVGDTLFWTLPSMNFDSAHFTAQVSVFVPTGLGIGDSVHFAAIILPDAGDGQPQDNFRTEYVFPIRVPMDPNEKYVYPPGNCAEHYVAKTDPLTYTIRFQNTGTAEAYEVVILDTLDADLDLATVSLKGNSHPVYLEVLPGNVLRFVFAAIHLPDSSTDEPASHGYVVYEVTPLGGLPDGTEVHNGSAIYFDFNPAFLTNVVMNTLVTTVPACPVGAAEGTPPSAWELYPNPATQIVELRCTEPLKEVVVMNAFGQQVYHRSDLQAHQWSIDVQAWARGLYLVKVNGMVKRLIVH